jgi:Trk K+ transport system NAD-binding subunit
LRFALEPGIMPPDMGDELSGHFVVCGLDELGFRCAEELTNLGEQVVLVDANPDPKRVHTLTAMGVKVAVGNYRDDEVLIQAGIRRARALIVAERHDAANIHATLSARELNPTLRVIVRLFNSTLGRRMQEVLPDGVVLSSSVIAAPAFVSAAIQTDFEQRVEVDGQVLILRHMKAEEDVLISVARVNGDGDIEFFPPPGEGVLCLTAEGGVTTGELVRHHARRLLPHSVLATWQLLRSLADRRLRYVLGTVAALILISSALFVAFARMTWLDALYFTVTTFTTIGYGDITLVNQAPALRVFGIFLELLGAGTLAVLFAVVTDALVGERLREALGEVRPELDDHVVVTGLGNIGHRVVEQLHAMRIPVIAMEADPNAKAVPDVRRQGVTVLIGDAREVDNLRALRVDSARCVLVTTDDDVANLEIALTARSLNPSIKVVMELHDPELAVRVQRGIGVGVSRSTAAVAAPAFVSAAIGHQVVSTLPVGDRTLVLARSNVARGAQADGRTIAWLEDGPYARVVKLDREGTGHWKPERHTVLDAGDQLLLVATRKGLDGVLRRTEAAEIVSSAQPRRRGDGASLK